MTARRNCSDEHSLPEIIARNTSAQFVYYADCFVADCQAGSNRVLAANDVDVGPTDSRQAHTDYSFAGASMWNRLLIQPKPAWRMKDIN